MRNYIYAGKYDNEIEYYSEGYGREYIQLSDNHTLWNIDVDDFDEDFYYSLVAMACNEFQKKTGVEVFLLGRSGRHVCVEDTEQNRRRYRSLCNTQRKLEQWVIDTFCEEMNNGDNNY